MSINTEGSMIPSAARELLTYLVANGLPLTVERAAVGNGALPADPDALTALVAEAMDGSFSQYTGPQDGEAKITVQVSSIGVEIGFNITEVGIYVIDPRTTEELILAYVPLHEHPQWMRPAAAAINNLAIFDVIVAVGDIEDIIITLDPSSLVSRADFDAEVATRAAADTTLQTNINNEATARSAADTALGGQISAHAADLITDADGAHGLKVETGTFTPTIYGATTPGTPTYTNQNGYYEKIGNLVYISGYVKISAKGGMVGAPRIGGLPFTVKNESTRFQYFTPSWGGIDFAVGYTNLILNAAYGQTYIFFYQSGDNVAIATMNVDQLADTLNLAFSGVYTV